MGAPLQESSLHRGGEMQILWLRVVCQLPLGACRSPSVASCQTKLFSVTQSWCSHSQLGLSINIGSSLVQSGSVLRFHSAPGYNI